MSYFVQNSLRVIDSDSIRFQKTLLKDQSQVFNRLEVRANLWPIDGLVPLLLKNCFASSDALQHFSLWILRISYQMVLTGIFVTQGISAALQWLSLH